MINGKNRLIKKMFLLFLCIIVIPSIIIIVLSNFLFQNEIIRKATSSFETDINNLSETLESQLFDTKLSSYYIYLDIDLKEAIEDYDRDQESSDISKQKVIDKFENYRISKSFANVNEIRVYGFNGFYMYFGEDNAISDTDYMQIHDSELYVRAIEDPDEFIWSGIYKDGDEKSISIYRVIKDREYENDVGMLYVKFDAKIFGSLVDRYGFDQKENIYILDKNNLNAMDYDVPRHIIDLIEENKQDTSKNYSYIIEGEGNEKYFINYITKYDWKVVGVLPVNDVTRDTRRIFLAVIIGLLIFLIFAYVIWFIVLSKTFDPIKNLTKATKEVREGNLKVQVEANNDDEIGDLTNDFNYMVRRIEELLNELLEENNRKRDAEYKALQAQINPHFLYNTLNSIRWMAKLQNAENIKKMVESLSGLLRNCTSKIGEFITIEEEVNILKDYVYIQKVAYTNKFNAIYDIDERVLKSKCLKFILQPLVENSIQHGILPKETYGTIWVDIINIDDYIQISIKDDGVGMSEKEIKNLLTTEDESIIKLSGIGLLNVYDRLKMTYGEKCSFNIYSEPGKLTKITINIPFYDKVVYEGIEGENDDKCIDS